MPGDLDAQAALSVDGLPYRYYFVNRDGSFGYDAYGVPFSCTLASPPMPEVEAYIAQAMDRYPYASVQYDAATDTVSGLAVSAPCEIFRSSP